MKINRAINKFPITSKLFIWMLVYLLIGIGSLPNIIVCLEKDGQINIEISCDCSAENPINNPNHYTYLATEYSDFSALEDQCHSCVDIPLSLNSDIPIVRTLRNTLEINSPILATNLSSLPTSANVFVQGNLYQPPLATYHTRSFLCTVVLLI